MIKKLLVVLGLSLFVVNPVFAQDPVSAGLEGKPAVEVGQPIIGDPSDVVDVVGLVISAFKDGRYFFAIGLILMALIWVFNKILKDKIPKNKLKWFVFGAAAAASMSAYFLAAPVGVAWYSTMLNGLMAAIGAWFTAMGAWNGIGKKLLKSNAPPK